MTVETIDTLIIGAGQAGIAMSEHLSKTGIPHLVLERNRIAERWRSERWDSLVANGPAWHDRFPTRTFDDIAPEAFAGKDSIVSYLEAHARENGSPVRCGVEVTALGRKPDGSGFTAETNQGVFEARNIVSATGPFQKPVFPALIPASSGVTQIHSSSYRNPSELPEGGVIVIGAGSSGVQIADELARAGRKVYLAVGPHNRPPRSYRGKDFVWWLGALGLWDVKANDPSLEHVTIAVSGARGGHTVDFRVLASHGITLVGRAQYYENGVLHFADDLAKNIAMGDADYLSVLDSADAYIAREGLDFPEEPEARIIGPEPNCVKDPVLDLDLAEAGVTSIIWATGYTLDYGWLKLDVMDERGRPSHHRGVSAVPGFYFLGLPWLSRRASPFIWGVWHDAKYLAEHIAARQD
ncbi:flavin-containing monooxygenase [Rhizobium sp. G21]|uniref:flavin-containing monooxygenase n=1 Tax=Rhizobium sp. G21 TaxID=2758439 RepID=UPI001603E839|nr:NAD(P)/FAD-dependent oxidoreductase [Rhizobium sp. G21]MBB1251352.1 NAD(P)-binding domain-containing protein [Rhizobium sp. G21]